MPSRPTPWPKFHSDLLPNIIFNLAAQYPSLTFARFPRDPTDISKGYRDFSYAELADAVNGFAWWIDEHVGKLEESRKNGSETLVYMGPNDIRYAVLCLGSIVAGYKMLFPSPRYGAEALIKLIEAADAKVILTPETPYPVQAEIVEKKADIQKHQVPSVEELFAKGKKVERYPFNKTFEECRNEPMIYLHTSGTTGFPKPIPWTHDWISAQSRNMHLPVPAGFILSDHYLHGRNGQGGARIMVAYPPFHASGIISMILCPLLMGTIPIYPTTGSTPEEVVDNVIYALKFLEMEKKKSNSLQNGSHRTNGENESESDKTVDCINMVPPHVEILARHPDKLDAVASRARAVRYGGGGISRATGDKVVQKVELVMGVGSTEQGFWPCIRHEGEDRKEDGRWAYFTPHPALNLRFDPMSEDVQGQAICEAVLVRNDGKVWGGYVQPLFKVFTDLQERRIGDLWIRHPKYHDLWKHYGRADDLQVFLTNEKFFPAAAEQRLASHPGIAEALLVGTRRPKASLIVRLNPGVKLEDLWGVIEQVNADSPVYARVEKNMVLVVEEPFLKTPKGSVRRVVMVEKYTKELDALYGESAK